MSYEYLGGLMGSALRTNMLPANVVPTNMVPMRVPVVRPHLSLVADTVEAPYEIESVDDDPIQWQDRALCAQTDPEAFFPEKGGSTREAKKICMGCEVRSECLEYALAHDERFGIWGGLSERERRRLKRGIS